MPVEFFLQTLMGSAGKLEPSSPDHLHNIFQSIKPHGNYGNENRYVEAVANAGEAVVSELIPRLKLVLGEERKDAISATNTVTDAHPSTGSKTTKRQTGFFKWERAYAVVSRAFDLATEGEYLVEFLYRFSELTDARRGKDDTVMLATEAEIALAKGFVRPWIHADDSNQRLFVRIRMPFGKSEREVVAGPAIAAHQSVLGRAILGLPVYDIQTGTVMFLKDSWRDINLPQESEILQILKTAGVYNVPTFVSDVTEEVGHPLETFKSSKQLTRIVYKAFLSHEEAFTKCKILHRDITGGNILIVYDKKAPSDKGDGEVAAY
ncbi:hypothetical protein EDD18DRAFT_1348287 [Armillaria luteobubalina]|uniref:Fungal-type protein kinase domain-containing protein n=1 Tax=Armillaria luteobubalina TaxID=153913 RepID=A0AA39QDD8_9AGAR|nr:hypothetical protein EDD18DRAFT_1348287 [Armillaria luteobubalina]